MKIRSGFVSNSSSSSFVAYGTCLESEDLANMLDLCLEKDEEIWMLTERIEIKLDRLLERSNLVYLSNEDGDFYIGREWHSIKDDETGKEFKDSTKKTIVNFFPEIKEYEIVSYDEYISY